MARNVEIKAKLPTAHAERVAARAQALVMADPQVLHQDDTFYACARGRLKLRRFADGTAELIAYRRPDLAGPKTSSYLRTPVADADDLHAALDAACGAVGRVRKRRRVVLVGRTRVHLDEVEGLGCFLELEVVLRDGEPECDGIDEAEALMLRLGVEPTWLVEGAYLDLLAAGPSDHQG
ncbi:MAG: class IV adenylate cyclase [Burkholderiaceae bacterium]|nr:class IV adenylate cyclase [Rhodoferax sp.]MCP5287058.1 class IV adenylate cyclase [Burkholderiaceae bacterium]